MTRPLVLLLAIAAPAAYAGDADPPAPTVTVTARKEAVVKKIDKTVYDVSNAPRAANGSAQDVLQAFVRDANGNLLQDGDDVVLVKDLKVKGSSLVLKMGTKVRGIRVVGGDHDVEGRVDGSPMMLKSVYLKKV